MTESTQPRETRPRWVTPTEPPRLTAFAAGLLSRILVQAHQRVRSEQSSNELVTSSDGSDQPRPQLPQAAMGGRQP
jgi:hypothetical protein